MRYSRVEAACKVLEKQGWRFDDDRDRAAVRRALTAADSVAPKYEQIGWLTADEGFYVFSEDDAARCNADPTLEPVYRKVKR